MHLLIDALSVNNLSGRHVLLGHLHEIVGQLPGDWRYTLLTHLGNAELNDAAPSGVAHECAPIGSGWFARAMWMRRHAQTMCSARNIDIVFSPAGLLSIGVARPQIVLAQNPWPLLPGMARGVERIKAGLQRRAYGRAQRNAALMVFNSQYMLDLYQREFKHSARRTIVAYQGIDAALFAQAASIQDDVPRAPIVLTVSVMARHKAIEVLVAAFARLTVQARHARLVLVGGWPDASYRQEIQSLIGTLELNDRVEFRGHVAAAELSSLYAQARVFCLPSRCESFGIPAIEAQAFGTPTVVAAGTAAPEVAGPGGLVVARDDVAEISSALSRLLFDDAAWADASQRARQNAERFHWRDCSAPLVAALSELRREMAAA